MRDCCKHLGKGKKEKEKKITNQPKKPNNSHKNLWKKGDLYKVT